MKREDLVKQDDLKVFQEELLTKIKVLLENEKPKPGKQWIKTYQLKQMIPFSDSKLQQLRGNGSLTCSIIDGLAFYDMDDVIAFMEKAKTMSRKNRKYGINRKQD